MSAQSLTMKVPLSVRGKLSPAKSVLDLPYATDYSLGTYAEILDDAETYWVIMPIAGQGVTAGRAWRQVKREDCYFPDDSSVTCTPSVEEDPNGLSQHTPGAKLDAGKNQLSLVLGGFARALEEVGKVGTYGAKKYSPNGWMQVDNGVSRYSDAMLRHYLKECIGEVFDPDTEGSLRHAAQVAWNALARLDLMLREEESKT